MQWHYCNTRMDVNLVTQVSHPRGVFFLFVMSTMAGLNYSEFLLLSLFSTSHLWNSVVSTTRSHWVVICTKRELDLCPLNTFIHLVPEEALPCRQMYRFSVLQRWSFQLKALDACSSTQFPKLDRERKQVQRLADIFLLSILSCRLEGFTAWLKEIVWSFLISFLLFELWWISMKHRNQQGVYFLLQ